MSGLVAVELRACSVAGQDVEEFVLGRHLVAAYQFGQTEGEEVVGSPWGVEFTCASWHGAVGHAGIVEEGGGVLHGD